MNSHLVLMLAFLVALSLSLTMLRLVTPKTSTSDLHELLTDICEVYENPSSYKVKTYNLPEITFRNGEIVLGESTWVYCSCCGQSGETVYVPIQCEEMRVHGLTTLILESRGDVVVVSKP